MLAISLQSGSNGNCIYVETCGTRLLFDAGISGSASEERLEAHGIDIRSIDAVIISHDHGDHCRCAGVLHRKYRLPIYMTEKTFEAAKWQHRLGRISDLRFFKAGDVIKIGAATVETIPTPHDAEDGAVFVISSGSKRLGILTDLGHVFDGLDNLVSNLDAVFIESNYDPRMLINGPYPRNLKERIQGLHGHISNIEAAELIARAGRRLKWSCLAHLSEQNNSPDVALRTHLSIVPASIPVYVASRYRASELFHV